MVFNGSDDQANAQDQYSIDNLDLEIQVQGSWQKQSYILRNGKTRWMKLTSLSIRFIILL